MSNSAPALALGLLGLLVQQPWAAAAEIEGTTTTNAITRLPTIVVTAQKLAEPAQTAPLSVTAINQATIDEANIRSVREASDYVPNIFLNEFTARKLSNPYFRGVGSSPNNPGVTTYIDGVPQLNANSSSIELLDIDQIEFVRGPQGTLFGRNTVGGLINLSSRMPASSSQNQIEASFGAYDLRDVRVSFSGPLKRDELGLTLSAGYSARDGYTKNRLTGHDLDSRDALFGKAQLTWKLSPQLDGRLIITGENADDGDYGLGDLASIRATPHRVSRDYEGSTARDLFAPTLLLKYHSARYELDSITGSVSWKTHDSTDLDYTPAALLRRDNQEEEWQFTQEFRVANTQPLPLGDGLDLNWQSGLFLFRQSYDQAAFNLLSPQITGAPIPIRSESRGNLDDVGVGVYGQLKLTLDHNLDLIVGARYDHEDKEATLNSFTSPPGPGAGRNFDDQFSEVSPHVALVYRSDADHMAYASIARGFKAGGFNATAPPGSEHYSEEHNWNFEAGYKSQWLDGKLQANLALFYIRWRALQLNNVLPVDATTFLPYIVNAGGANSKGVELELRARPNKNWDLFGSFGYTDAEFRNGSRDNGVSVAHHDLPYTPEYKASVGTQMSWEWNRSATVYARAEVTMFGTYAYDASNRQSQDSYSLANFRLGVRGDRWFLEGWANNAFGTDYVPIAFAFRPEFAPSGYLGESGAPATFGIRAGYSF